MRETVSAGRLMLPTTHASLRAEVERKHEQSYGSFAPRSIIIGRKAFEPDQSLLLKCGKFGRGSVA